MKKGLQVYDFFSGCGGTSEGFRRAGCDIAFGLDNDRDASNSFRANFEGVDFYEGNIQQAPFDVIKNISSRDTRSLFSGCAPCQPFSKQNQSKLLSDPRRNLLVEFGRFINEFRPDYIFVENVPGLQHVNRTTGPLPDFTQLLTRIGYQVDIAVISASRFGVPQTRERLVLLAGRDSHISLQRILPKTSSKGTTVRDWIFDLPPLVAGERHADDTNHVAAKLSPLNLARIRATPEGGDRRSWPKRLWLDCHKDHVGHSDVYGRLAWDKTASALTTRCNSYSNGRFGHPTQDRALSIREAACLQTFPREYQFTGSLAAKARQIGNAVPPLMAYVIGRALLEATG